MGFVIEKEGIVEKGGDAKKKSLFLLNFLSYFHNASFSRLLKFIIV